MSGGLINVFEDHSHLKRDGGCLKVFTDVAKTVRAELDISVSRQKDAHA